MKRLIDILVGFIAGACTGILLGTLYAPDKGNQTRKRLTYKLDKYRNILKDVLEEAVKKDKNLQPNSEAKQEGQKVIDDATEKAEQLLGEVGQIIEQIKANKN
ncbi:MAG: YtxH domain-containing protein [Bacteroidetes bacterium]|nr:MAG: YtxH domain-containing protein [Bacteroidota bacterium]